MPSNVLCALVALLLACSAAPISKAATTSDAKPSAAAENLADFDFVTRTIADDYSGYDVKVTPANRAELDKLTIDLRAKAATASDAELWGILSTWVGFFHDRHTHVDPARPLEAPTHKVENGPRPNWTTASVRARLTALGSARDPVEGIWQLSGNDEYTSVGILRADPTRFDVVLLTPPEEQSRQVGYILRDAARALWFVDSGDYGEERLHARLVADGGAITFDHPGRWTRQEPALADADFSARVIPSDQMFLRRLSAKTLWLRMPDFDDSRAAPLKALLETHAADLAATPNLVIDLRGNPGGSDYVYEPLLPFIYTQPTYVIGMELRATRDNIALRHAEAERIRAEAPDQADQLEADNRLMAQHLGGYVHPGPKGFGVDIHDAVLPSPKRVVVLIDGAGSTAEQFVLYARQSHKVTLMGERNSAGVLDFANVVSEPTPSGRFRLQWAISRSLRLPADPVDPVGIAPQIRIPADEIDPVTFAQTWLERQVD